MVMFVCLERALDMNDNVAEKNVLEKQYDCCSFPIEDYVQDLQSVKQVMMLNISYQREYQLCSY